MQPWPVYVIFALFALVVFGAGILVGVFVASLRTQQPPLLAETRTPAPSGPRFSCIGPCWTNAECDCPRYDGLRDGTRVPPLHDGCTCILEGPGSYFAQAERAVSGIQMLRASERP